ncbi:MAG: Glutamine transport ATP-binding protein GlnQ [Pseudomonadota bacterium]|jgi:branched-chain amino acid transport system permease protein
MGHKQLKGLWVMLGLILLVPWLPLPSFWLAQLNYIGLFAITSLGLVLLTGVAGLTSFGQAAFVGMGAYTAAWCALNLGWPPLATLMLGLLITAAAAWIIGRITLRLSGHYLPLATIAWGLSLYYLMGNLEALGKFDGLIGLKSLSLLGIEVGQGRGFFAVSWVLLWLVTAALIFLLDSRPGRAIRALKDGRQMAEAMGVDTFGYKVTVFVIAALLASLSGWLLAYYQRAVNPSAFGLKMGIEYLFMAVVGGVNQLWGAWLGAAVVRLMDEQLQQWLPALLGASGSFEVIVFGVLLVLILKYRPEGLWSWLKHWQAPAKPKHDYLDAEPLAQRSKPRVGELVLDIRDIRKNFGGLVAVNDISFQVHAGQIVGLIGPNGAGKSTLFNLVTGTLALSAGQVHFRGEPVQGKHARDIARMGLMRTFQHVKIIPDMTVLENVALGAHTRGRCDVLSSMLRINQTEEKQLMKEAQRQLERVGMGHYADEQAGNLAMGLQRLMEIARALSGDPALLLLDEPAAGLRHQEKKALAAVLRQLQGEGMSILLVEHDMDLVMDVCDHLVVMEFGTLLTQGTPQAIQQSPAVRAAYLGTEH